MVPPHTMVPRRALLSTLSALTVSSRIPARAPTAVASVAQPPTRFAYDLRSVNVNGVTVPVACWCPATLCTDETASATEYPYAIDVGRIAARLRVGWLSWLPRFDRPLPCGTTSWNGLPSGFSRSARQGDAIIFAHGFLGSPYDCAHICEALASDGFLVCAPEMPESLAASYREPESGITREEIITASRELWGGQARRWGIFGHSAGAGSALYQRGGFPLGRVGLCPGYRGGVDTSDPIFLIASDGDGCNRFQQIPLRTILAAEAHAGLKTTLFSTAEEAYASPRAGDSPRRGALVFSATEPAITAAPPLPCHISFLWSKSNDALVTLLAPLLPLAQALGIFVLDFDVFLRNRDSEATAATTTPAVRRFFLVGSGR